METLAVPVIVFDIAGRARYLNASAGQFLQSHPERAKGNRLSDLMRLTNAATGRTLHDPVLECVRNAGSRGRIYVDAMLHRGAEPLPVYLTLNLMRNWKEEIIGIVLELNIRP